jgi:ABC-type phosphate/phosphonate transport system substrate-binding protein
MQSKTVVALLALALSGWGVSATAKTYRFGVAIDPTSASNSSSARQRALEQLAKALSERLQEPVALEVLTTPSDEATALEVGRIDMALLKAVAYGRAKDRDSKISGLVTVVSRNENEEETTHSGYIIALQTSRIDQLPDLKGKRFGFVRGSASGLAYPISYLSRHGLDYRSGFSHRCYADHYQLIKALNAGEIDAATTFRSPLLKRNSDLAHFKIIARIADIPNPLIAVSASLTTAEKQKLTAALTSLPESAFEGVGFFGLKTVDEKLYDPVVKLGALDVCG